MIGKEPTNDAHAQGGGGEDAQALEGARVVFVLPELELGGAERQALLLARYLARERGARVEFWALGGGPGRVSESCESLGIPWRVVRLGWFAGRLGRLKGLARFALELRRARADVLLPYLIMPNVACGLVWRWAGARLCVWNQRDGTFTRLAPRAELRAARRTPWFVSNSEHGAKFLKETLGAPGERVRVIRNGVELNAPRAGRAEWRARLGFGDDTFAACMVANLTRYKDHETLLKAWRRVVDSCEAAGRSVILLLAGRLDGSESAHDFVRMSARDLGLEECVRFLGHVEDVSGLLGASDIGVFSSRAESSPNGVLECMAAGLAVAATDVDGVRDALGPGGRQFLAPPGDADALAERILALLNDAALRAKAGAENRTRAESEFGPRRMCEETAALLAEGLRGKGLRATESTAGRVAVGLTR